MPAPRKYSEELKDRATRDAAEQLDIILGRLRTVLERVPPSPPFSQPPQPTDHTRLGD